MANETELERIVVRLIGDGSSFHKMMTGAAVITQKTTTQMITALNRVEGFANTLLGTFGSLGVAASLKGAFDQFAKMERGQIRLNSIIETNGGNVATLTARYREVAEAISSVTLNTKGEILSLFQMAEAQQFSGDAAENVVRNSVALAGATGQSAESMIRVAAMMQRGHPEFAKRILGLRGVADGAQLVDAIQRRMAGGMALAQAEFNSASGRMERLGRSLKSVGVEVGGLIAKFLLPAADFVQRLTEQFKGLDAETKKVVYQVFGLTLAFMGMGPVVSVLRGLLNPLISLAYYLAVTLPLTILNVAAWTAWKVVMLISKAILLGFQVVLLLFNVQLAVWSTLLSASAVASGVWSAAVLVAKVATWLWNAALSVLNILLAPAFLLAAMGTVVLLAGAFILVSAAVGTVVELATAMVGFFNLLPGVASGPMATIASTFGGWIDIIKEVVVAMQKDIPSAMQLAKAGFNLALVQIRVLFPPIWDFIKGGFKVAFDWVAAQIETSFGNMIQRMRVEFLSLVQDVYGGPIGTYLFGDMTEEITRLQTGIATNARLGAQNNLAAAERGLQELRDRYAGHVMSDAERAEISAAQQAVDDARVGVRNAANRTAPAAQQAGQVIGGALKKGVKSETDKINAILFGSAEALSQIAKYVDRFREANPAGAVPVGSTARPANLLGGSGDPTVVTLLRDISASNRQIASRPTIELDSAELE